MITMTRDQARTILIGLGSPSSEEDRAAAIGVVVDLVTQQYAWQVIERHQRSCSCNQPDATHPLGDSAFCSMGDG